MKCALVLILALASVPLARAGEDLADGYLRARAVVARHLGDVKLNSVYGTPAFDAHGARIDDVFLNFCGKDAAGNPMLMSLTLTPQETLLGEGDPDNPRPDKYGHHLKPGIALDVWLPCEEAVAIALAQHVGHDPTAGGISLAYFQEKVGGRVLMVLYWRRDQQIHDAVIDARYGDVLSIGHTPWPDAARKD